MHLLVNRTVAAFVLKLMNRPVMEYYGLLHLPHSSSVLDLLKLCEIYMK